MTPATLHSVHLKDARLYDSRDTMITALAKRKKCSAIAEVGVAFGDCSLLLIQSFQPQCFDAYDLFEIHQWPSMWGKDPREILGDKTHKQYYEERILKTKPIDLRCFEGDSSAQLSAQSNYKYDLIYIDGAHDYAGVKKDAEAALQNIKDDGVLIFNDYIMYDHITCREYGVVQVVNDLCINGGWKMTGLSLHPQMFCDVMLER